MAHDETMHYPDDAVLVVYELTPDTTEALNDPDVSEIAIYDTRDNIHFLISGETPFDIVEWGTLTASAFHRDNRIAEPTIEKVEGHPFMIGIPDRTDPECCVIAWVTEGQSKGSNADAFIIHIGIPSAFDPIGQNYAAGVIANPVTKGDYSPWAVCYDWGEDAICHNIDCPKR